MIYCYFLYQAVVTSVALRLTPRRWSSVAFFMLTKVPSGLYAAGMVLVPL